MLSRLALNTGNISATFPKVPPKFVLCNVRVGSTAPAPPPSSAIVEGPERDLVNFPRPVRLMYGGKVRLGFIPEEWFQFFYKKTGVTGPYVFGVGFATYLLSKEIVPMEHEFWTGVGLAIIFTFGIKKFGPGITAAIDRNVDEYEEGMNSKKNKGIQDLENAIEAEKKEQWRAKGQKYLFEAKRENVLLQLEAEYRHRLMNVYEETKKRLDYQLDVQAARRKFEQKHMVDWIVNNVIKSITAEQEKQAMQQCVSDLKKLALKAY